MRLGCLWNRSRLTAFADEALDAPRAAAVARHLAGCAGCRERVDSLQALRAALRGVGGDVSEPDWTGFWTGLERRLRVERGTPMREPWWRPYWKPIWGHPRAALATGALTAMLIAVPFWPGPDQDGPLATAGPVTVQDVGSEDPDSSVMVYADPDRGSDRGVTVIWVFASAQR
ncbi:MAG TPA: zf-HC2 domain-containing protein [Methylomirabilota bacterium]|nr:zf-HC2 domain-containing protein [Methylomirabilota bacterium]